MHTTVSPAGRAAAVSIRPGTLDDARACLDLLWEAVTDLGNRQGRPLQGSADDWWTNGMFLHRFLAEHAAEWWLATDAKDASRLLGYARSVERSGLFELTEFFVRPGEQARGVGRSLLECAFPAGRGDVRAIIATTDVRALTRYYRTHAVARFPFLSLAGVPADAEAERLSPVPVGDDAAALTGVIDLERAVLGYPRSKDEIRFLLSTREGYIYQREGVQVGFAFVGKSGSGPIGALDPADMPDILRHVEGRAHALGVANLELEVPGPNAVAIRHLLGRGFRIDPWINLLMSDRPFGQFDRFIGFSPPIFL